MHVPISFNLFCWFAFAEGLYGNIRFPWQITFERGEQIRAK